MVGDAAHGDAPVLVLAGGQGQLEFAADPLGVLIEHLVKSPRRKKTILSGCRDLTCQYCSIIGVMGPATGGTSSAGDGQHPPDPGGEAGRAPEPRAAGAARRCRNRSRPAGRRVKPRSMVSSTRPISRSKWPGLDRKRHGSGGAAMRAFSSSTRRRSGPGPRPGDGVVQAAEALLGGPQFCDPGLDPVVTQEGPLGLHQAPVLARWPGADAPGGGQVEGRSRLPRAAAASARRRVRPAGWCR